ncbi:hypothetical protein HPB50_004510 [Hyalomma asiaticum]|uniref:Uncharacterized protein n=1 Tax=Hyalomma asiaticum TaxID=266040 RepID=A0ACB7RVG6_HYAAI|nr:hypothetical protein HPB50_004510 [Hyalomma asiaticum]
MTSEWNVRIAILFTLVTKAKCFNNTDGPARPPAELAVTAAAFNDSEIDLGASDAMYLKVTVEEVGPVNELDMSVGLDARMELSWPFKTFSCSGIFRLMRHLKNVRHEEGGLRVIGSPITFATYRGLAAQTRLPEVVVREARLVQSASDNFEDKDLVFTMDSASNGKRCSVTYSASFPENVTKFLWSRQSPIKVNPNVGLVRFEATVLGPGRSNDDLTLKLRLARRMGDQLVGTYAPTALLVVCSWPAFWLGTVERLSLGGTLLLALTQQSAAARRALPPSVALTPVDWWMSGCVALVLAVIVETTVACYEDKQLHSGLVKYLTRVRRDNSGTCRNASPTGVALDERLMQPYLGALPSRTAGPPPARPRTARPMSVLGVSFVLCVLSHLFWSENGVLYGAKASEAPKAASGYATMTAPALESHKVIKQAISFVPVRLTMRLSEDEMDQILHKCTGQPHNFEGSYFAQLLDAKFRGLFVFPGTKWCGRGNVARNYEDLGEAQDADMCCREHDYAADSIPPHKSFHGLENKLTYTIHVVPNQFSYRLRAVEFSMCDISARMHCLAERRSKIGQTVTGKYTNPMRVSNSIAAATARPTFFRFISFETRAPNLRQTVLKGDAASVRVVRSTPGKQRRNARVAAALVSTVRD